MGLLYSKCGDFVSDKLADKSKKHRQSKFLHDFSPNDEDWLFRTLFVSLDRSNKPKGSEGDFKELVSLTYKGLSFFLQDCDAL